MSTIEKILTDHANKIVLVVLVVFFGWRLRDTQVLSHFVDLLLGALTAIIVPKVASEINKQ